MVTGTIPPPWIWSAHHAVHMSLALQGLGAMGAGDFLMSFLGVVIISMGFRIYQQVGTKMPGMLVTSPVAAGRD